MRNIWVGMGDEIEIYTSYQRRLVLFMLLLIPLLFEIFFVRTSLYSLVRIDLFPKDGWTMDSRPLSSILPFVIILLLLGSC
jgi:hypothetical protein